jgi:hypothetical protein
MCCGEDEVGQVHINATSEGVIADVWVTRDEHLDHNIGTSNETVDGIVSTWSRKTCSLAAARCCHPSNPEPSWQGFFRAHSGYTAR